MICSLFIQFIEDTFHDFTQTTNLETEVSTKMGYSFGYWWFRTKIKGSSTSTSTSKVETKTRYLAAVMRIERYYASLREEKSPLNKPAAELLNLQDYVGFFKACGPTYIRGIRRAQEVTAIFSFKSISSQIASQYTSTIKVSSGWWRKSRLNGSTSSKSNFSSASATLQIDIVGYGLGLTEEGSETLIATSLEDFDKVMKFAFNSMTKSKNSVHIGMVYGMEVVPWVHNTQFQIESGLHDEVIEIPLSRSMIPRAYHKDDVTNMDFQNTLQDRTDFRCKEISYEIDKYGYCCELEQLYNYEEEEYDGDSPEDRVCRPLRSLDKAIVKDNMSNNGEFVARLDRAIRHRMNQLSVLEKCISAARAIPERFDYNLLKPQDTVKYDGTIDLSFSVLELKLAIDPFYDYSMVRHLGEELDEYIDMFYQPCLAAIFGSNIGTTAETDASYFMAYPWHTHDECTKLSCLGNSMRWERSGDGGCVPGLISGNSAQSYDNDDGKNCKKDPNSGSNTCKYDSKKLNDYYAKATKSWESVLPVGRIDYFMEHFCLPQVTENTLTKNEANALRTAYVKEIAEDKTMNVALGKFCKQSTTAHGGEAGRAVDGNLNGRYRNNGITHTRQERNPWWYVDLEDEFTIEKIIVYNRMDCCSERLAGFKVLIYHKGRESWTATHSGVPGKKTVFTVPNKKGDRVYVQLLGSGKILSLAEVEVWNRF